MRPLPLTCQMQRGVPRVLAQRKVCVAQRLHMITSFARAGQHVSFLAHGGGGPKVARASLAWQHTASKAALIEAAPTRARCAPSPSPRGPLLSRSHLVWATYKSATPLFYICGRYLRERRQHPWLRQVLFQGLVSSRVLQSPHGHPPHVAFAACVSPATQARPNRPRAMHIMGSQASRIDV